MLIWNDILTYKNYQLEKNVDNNENIKEIINEKIETIEPESKDEKVKYNIDFTSLKEINSDTVAYIKVNNTNIDYVVVKGKNNEYYLKYNFEKKWNTAGWIFADYHNKFDEADKNIVIFGHNTRDGSMFETLKNVLNKDWYENNENHEVVLVTEMGTYYYEVFSTYSIVAEDYYINTQFNSIEEFGKFIKEIKSRSVHDYGSEVSDNDKILTLSSCLGDGKKRVVLHAKLKYKV